MPEVQNFKPGANWFATDTIGTPKRKVGSRCRRLHLPVDRVDSPNTCYHRSIIMQPHSWSKFSYATGYPAKDIAIR
jgi:hypothetical protein